MVPLGTQGVHILLRINPLPDLLTEAVQLHDVVHWFVCPDVRLCRKIKQTAADSLYDPSLGQNKEELCRAAKEIKKDQA